MNNDAVAAADGAAVVDVDVDVDVDDVGVGVAMLLRVVVVSLGFAQCVARHCHTLMANVQKAVNVGTEHVVFVRMELLHHMLASGEATDM